jgi:hypothetical protein
MDCLGSFETSFLADTLAAKCQNNWLVNYMQNFWGDFAEENSHAF